MPVLSHVDRYESPQHIMEEFYALRVDFYVRRKTSLLNKMQSEWSKLDNKAGYLPPPLIYFYFFGHVQTPNRNELFIAVLSNRRWICGGWLPRCLCWGLVIFTLCLFWSDEAGLNSGQCSRSHTSFLTFVKGASVIPLLLLLRRVC